MKNIQPLSNLVLLFILLLAGCAGSAQNEYIVSGNIDSSELRYDKFFPPRWQKYEDSMIKSFSLKAPTKEEQVYEDNRMNNIAIIYPYENDSTIKINSGNKNSENFVRAISKAIYYNDTLKISIGIGFFAGAAVVINITGNSFSSEYEEGSDGEGDLKYELTDSNYVNDIKVKAVAQKLTLNKRPSYKNGEILMGEYEGTFKPFYENEVGKVSKKKVKWRIIFKCGIFNMNDAMKDKNLKRGS